VPSTSRDYSAERSGLDVLSNDFGGISRNDTSVGDILCDDCTCGNNNIIPNCHTRQYDTTSTYETVAANFYIFRDISRHVVAENCGAEGDVCAGSNVNTRWISFVEESFKRYPRTIRNVHAIDVAQPPCPRKQELIPEENYDFLNWFEV
jgi:hypothetical protein